MTQSEKTQWLEMSNKLEWKGLTFQEWEVMVELRKKHLISRGENPDHWNLGSKKLLEKVGISNIISYINLREDSRYRRKIT